MSQKPKSTLKNILVIDGAKNTAYDIYAVTEKQFKAIFPKKNQDIEFAEDLQKRWKKSWDRLLETMWDNPVRKREAHGIHGILFYELRDQKKSYYPNKRDSDLDGWARGWISEPRRFNPKIADKIRKRALRAK